MRALLPVVLAACTISGRGPDPVTKPPAPDPDRMPAAVLDKQDPAADTSKHPVLSTTSAHAVDNDSYFAGCLRLLACDSGGAGRDASGLVIVLAALAATRKRNRS